MKSGRDSISHFVIFLSGIRYQTTRSISSQLRDVVVLIWETAAVLLIFFRFVLGSWQTWYITDNTRRTGNANASFQTEEIMNESKINFYRKYLTSEYPCLVKKFELCTYDYCSRGTYVCMFALLSKWLSGEKPINRNKKMSIKYSAIVLISFLSVVISSAENVLGVIWWLT